MNHQDWCSCCKSGAADYDARMNSLISKARNDLASGLHRYFRVAAIAIVLALGLTHQIPVSAADAPADPKSPPALPRVVIPKLHGTIKVDGDLREAVWCKAAVIEPLYRNDGSGREREHTRVRLWYDDEALYLGWTCQDSDIQGTFTRRDSKLWEEEEVVEFFVAPENLSRYFELQWNPLGGIFDATIENDLDERGLSKAFRGDPGFTAKGMKSAVKVKGTVGKSSARDEFWQVEIRLPFADLGQPTPKPKAVWRANFHRYNRGEGHPTELLSWSPTLNASFHQPSRFGTLEFAK